MSVQVPIYLDNHATTRLDPQVLEAMMPYLTHNFGNAASKNHSFGWQAAEGVKLAREQVAKLIGASAKEIIWTSGATESDNLAIIGAARYNKAKGKHIVTTVIEHKAVLDACHALEAEGFEITFVEVDSSGVVKVDDIAAAIRDDTIVVSVMLANNEIGTIQPIAEIGALCREKRIIFHCDAVQGLGKLSIDVAALKVDLLSMSAHKMYGPKGIGALYVRRGRPRIRIEPLIHGGGHERGMRSGTLASHQIVGFGKAAELALDALTNGEIETTRAKRDRLWAAIQAGLDHVFINGSMEHRLPNNLNVSFAFCEGEAIMMAIKDVAVSSGSACTSASLEPSYVLRALGVEAELAHTSIRFGIGRFNTDEEIDYVAKLVVDKINDLREMSPLYEMVLEGIDIKSIQWDAH
jgi:cysteine desulfurase